jgi:beta-galactosidase
MKHISLALLLLFYTFSLKGQILGTRTVNLKDWAFSLDSIHWQSVTIPHSYNAIDGHSPKYYRGKGYYRKTESLSRTDLKRPLILLFEGAAQQATVYINNKPVIHHRGGYTPFWLSLNGLVHEGENTVAVTCDNHEDINLIPVNSDFNKNGGLHNPAFLLKMSPLYFSPEHTGLYRLHVSTPVVNEEQAVTVMTARIGNGTGRKSKVTVTYSLLDAEGNQVYSHNVPYEVGVGQKTQTVTDRFTLSHPHLWNGVKDPYLYQAVIILKDRKGNVLDEVRTKIGYRFYQVTADKGFLLNGHPYPLRGVAEHQDMAGEASAVTEADIDRDYRIIQELGCNFLRLAHYPHRDYEYQLCDSLGIIVQTEIPWVDVCGIHAQEEYFDNIHQQMQEMITSLYNHPSIVFWGMWNEIDNWGNNDHFQGLIDCKRVASETARLYDYAKSLDPQRLVGVTDCSLYEREGYAGLKGDFFSENRYNGWYYQKANPTHIADEMAEVHNIHAVCNLSEYGAGIDPFCHTTETDMNKLRADDKYHFEEHGNLVHEEHVRQIQKMPFLNFTSAWVLFDFPVAARQEGFMDSDDGIHFTIDENKKYINDKGLVTRDRKVKKDIFYLYKSLWNHQAKTVYITGRRLKKLSYEKPYSVKVYSNATCLQLFVDGKWKKNLPDCTDPSGVIWSFRPIVLSPGRHEIKVIGDGVEDTVFKDVE